nr:hypothetical protein [Tanacetum cinerariifolium]
MSTTKAESKTQLFLDELEVRDTGSMIVMVCRIWDVNDVIRRYLSTYFVISDAKGNIMHATARSNVAHKFLKLKSAFVKYDGFIEYPFELVKLRNLKLTNNKHMIGKGIQGLFSSGLSQGHLIFYPANSRGYAVRVTLWGGLGENLIEKRTCHVSLYLIVLTSL